MVSKKKIIRNLKEEKKKKKKKPASLTPSQALSFASSAMNHKLQR
jgi:hypothetical protein